MSAGLAAIVRCTCSRSAVTPSSCHAGPGVLVPYTATRTPRSAAVPPSGDGEELDSPGVAIPALRQQRAAGAAVHAAEADGGAPEGRRAGHTHQDAGLGARDGFPGPRGAIPV